jgi:hypothetical protein
MTFKKGEVSNPKGRAKGGNNPDTRRFKIALCKLFEQNADNLSDWLTAIAAESPERALDILHKFSDFIYPKLGRTVVSGDPDNPLVTVKQIEVTVIK